MTMVKHICAIFDGETGTACGAPWAPGNSLIVAAYPGMIHPWGASGDAWDWCPKCVDRLPMVLLATADL